MVASETIRFRWFVNFGLLTTRVRTHKGDSIIEGFVIHGFRQETCNESRLFLAYEGSVRTA
jgi:hypothetical protein